jgi:hypothetical protein
MKGPQPMSDDYTMALQLCDESGLVSDEQVDEDGAPFPHSYLQRHVHLQGLTQGGREFLKAHPECGEKSWPCTGHAHLAGQHIRCTSPSHARTDPTRHALSGGLEGRTILSIPALGITAQP